jgi:hypothetical protein
MNDPPTLDPLPPFFVVSSSAVGQVISLSGITPGPGESQSLWLTADTTNPQWIRDLSISYPGSGTTATLSFSVTGPTGSGLITVNLMDGGLDNDLATVGDNQSVSRTMAVLSGSNPLPMVTVAQASGQPDPANEVPLHFTVVFSEAVSDFAAEDVTLSGTAPGTLVAVVSGSGTMYDVAVSGMTDGGTVSVAIAAGVAHTGAGNPNQASTSSDNQIVYNPWHHAADPFDVDGNTRVEAADVLTLIDYINSHPGEQLLPAPPAGNHPWYDVDGSRGCTAADVLLVINLINSRSAAAEGESRGAEVSGVALPGTPSSVRAGRPDPALLGGPSSATRAAGPSGRESFSACDPSPIAARLAEKDSRPRRGPQIRREEELPALDADVDGVLEDLAADVDRVWFGLRS